MVVAATIQIQNIACQEGFARVAGDVLHRKMPTTNVDIVVTNANAPITAAKTHTAPA